MPKHDNQFLPIRLGSSHAFFIPTRMGAVLIDAGNAHKMTQLRSVLHAHEYNLSDITHIIITHTHHDHVGSLAELQKRTGARIIVHESEADYLRTGRTPLPRGVTPYCTTYYPAHGKPIEREKFMRCWMKWQKKLA